MDSTTIQPARFLGAEDDMIRVCEVIGHSPGKEWCGAERGLPITDIRMLQFRRKGQVGRSLAITLPVSMLFGTLLSMGSEEVEWFGTLPTFDPVPFLACTVVGLGFGVAIGSARTTYRFDGSRKRYDHLRRSLKNYE